MTAIKYLIEKLKKQKFVTNSQILIAEQMEKKQIETAFEDGMFHHINALSPSEYYEEIIQENKIY